MRAAAALAVLALAGCGGSGRAQAPTPEPTSPAARATPEPPTDEQQIEDVLRKRATALEAGDRRAYVATGVRRGADRLAVTRARDLRLRDVGIDPGNIDVTGTRATTYACARPTASASCRELPDVPPRRPRQARAGTGGWRACGAGAGCRRGRSRAFAEHRTRHFVLLAPASVPVDELLAALEDGYTAIRSRLEGGRLRRRYLVIAAADAGQARALTEQIRGLETLAAISDASIIERGAAQAISRVVSLRLLVVYSAYSSESEEGRRRTVAHELTHAALAGETSGRTPAWLAEGVAMYVSGDRRAAPPGADLGKLSDPDAIARLAGDAQADAYGASSAAAFAIVERFGARRLLRLYDAFNDEKLRGPAGPPAGQPGAAARAGWDHSPRCRKPHRDLVRRYMPELPEVETIRRHLAPHVEGRTLEASRCSTSAGRGRSPAPSWLRRSRAGSSSA